MGFGGISIWQLLIVLAIIILLFGMGPERMPEAVRSTMLTIGRVKRMLGSAFQDIEKQVGADEIRQQLHNEDVMKSLAQAQEGLSDLDSNIDASISETLWTKADQEAYEEEIQNEENAAALAEDRDPVSMISEEPEEVEEPPAETDSDKAPRASS